MAAEGKHSEEAKPAALPNEFPGDTSDQISLSGSSDRGQIIYTPPESVTSMASSREGTTGSAASSTAKPAMMTATHGDKSVSAVGTANISVREYIYFLPYPLPAGTPIPYSIGLPNNNPLKLPPHQFEPTSTLVLTSPNRIFVDIRLFKPFDLNAATPLPNKSEKERLEWAFAGTSESTAIPKGEPGTKKWKGLSHSKWTHWLDSRNPVGDPNIPVDEGDMYPITKDLTLEHGHAFHPALKAEKTHEEMWRDQDALSTNTIGTKICVVLRVQADAAGVRGVVVRVGQYCQGIVMQGEHTTVERWEFQSDAGKGEEATKWKRTARVGDHFLPCAATFRPEVLALGGIVKYHDYEWVVEEVWEWK